MRSLVFAAIAVLATPVYADEWVKVASSDANVFSAKAGSFEIRENKRGDAIAVMTGSSLNKRSGQISYAQWYVAVGDCERGMGKLVNLTTTGDFDFESDFVAGGSSVGAAIADTICGLYKASVKTREGKGL